jgi:uncharacterized protein YjbI with pentapeptide repeats
MRCGTPRGGCNPGAGFRFRHAGELAIHHSRYTASGAGPVKERKAEMTDPSPPEHRDEKRLNWRRPAVWAAIGLVGTIVLTVAVAMVLLGTGDAKAVSDNAPLIGALVALGGVFTAQVVSIALEDQRTRETRALEEDRTDENRRIEKQRTQDARDIEAQRVQDAALKQYFEQMGQLVEKGLRDCDEKDEKRILARTQTLLVLRELDPRRKWLLLDFLYESKLLDRPDPVVNLANADFRDGVFTEYLAFRSVDSTDVREYLGDTDPRKYLSRGDLGSALSNTEGIPQPLMEIFLGGATLRIELHGADLHGASFIGAFLRQGDLRNINLEDALLAEADLIGAELPNASLRNAVLPHAVLIGADLKKAELAKANLTGAVLIKTDLSEADLRGATLWEANLYGANLSDANLSDANLYGAMGKTKEQLEDQTASLAGATMPDGTKHPDSELPRTPFGRSSQNSTSRH